MDTYKTKKLQISGAICALATPFEGGRVDNAAFSNICKWQIDMGTDALCVCGTTGEAATLTTSEKRGLIMHAKDICQGKVPLVVGCGAADTEVACRLCKEACSLGADALLIITPYCNKGTSSGILEHYKRVADAAGGKPMILYNVPSRTGVDLSFAQYTELAKIPNVCGVKEATSNLTKITRLCGETELAIYSGNDDMVVPVISLGGSGVISVLSNLVPSAVSTMARAALEGDFDRASRLSHKYAYIISLLFEETNPAPLKYAMSLLGLCTGELRLPMGEISDTLKQKIKEELAGLSII